MSFVINYLLVGVFSFTYLSLFLLFIKSVRGLVAFGLFNFTLFLLITTPFVYKYALGNFSFATNYTLRVLVFSSFAYLAFIPFKFNQLKFKKEKSN